MRSTRLRWAIPLTALALLALSLTYSCSKKDEASAPPAAPSSAPGPRTDPKAEAAPPAQGAPSPAAEPAAPAMGGAAPGASAPAKASRGAESDSSASAPPMDRGAPGAAAGGGAGGAPGTMVAMLSRTSSITGEVKLEGAPPQMQPLKRGVDPVCGKKPMNDEQVLSRNGKLENVVVWISEGAAPSEPPARPAKLEQVDCMYRPRVQAIQAGQALEVHNADKTLHNVRAMNEGKNLFNKAQLPGGPDITETARKGVMQFKCDVHPWMKAYAVVLPHQYSDVTGEDGHFSIRGLPAGKYTVTAWHELFGRKSTEITLQEGKATPILFSFNAQDRE